MTEKIVVGQYKVIGSDKDWRVMEQFGDYRMLKKVFKNKELAVDRATKLNALRESN